MTNDHNKTRDRTLGSYYTADLTVKYIVEKVMPYVTKDSKILDFAAGNGIFLKEFLAHGVSPEQLYAYDINQELVKELRKTFPNTFSSDSILELKGEFDIIIGNPPYSSNECDYIKQHREHLRKKFYPIAPSNLYSLFCVSALRHLKEGGIMSVIILDSFVSNVYYKPFREYLLNTCKIKEILLAPRRLFHKENADVRTAILTMEKCSGPLNAEERNNNTAKLIDRVETEEEYQNPKQDSIQTVKQGYFFKMPESTFFVNLPQKILDLITETKTKLDEYLGGGTGISTGNDGKFLKPTSEVKNNPKWVGYYKNGIRGAYHYEPTMFIEKDYKKHAEKVSNFMLRNEQFFFKEGITCSSVGVNFSDSYMPPGNLFGVNANFFAKNKTELYYALGLLNSKIAIYILKKVFNRTNNVSSKYIKRLPYLSPTKEEKEEIASYVKKIVSKLKQNKNYDYSSEQKYLDEFFFDLYGIDGDVRKQVEYFTADVYNLL